MDKSVIFTIVMLLCSLTTLAQNRFNWGIETNTHNTINTEYRLPNLWGIGTKAGLTLGLSYDRGIRRVQLDRPTNLAKVATDWHFASSSRKDCYRNEVHLGTHLTCSTSSHTFFLRLINDSRIGMTRT